LSLNIQGENNGVSLNIEIRTISQYQCASQPHLRYFIIQDLTAEKASERAIRVILPGDMARVAFCAARER
jgi:hypothetical protein